MCVVKKGPNHGPAPIPEEGKWVKAKEIKDISGLTHGIGWCAPQQGTDPEYQRRGNRRSLGGNYRLFRNDPFSSYGCRNPAGQNDSRSIEYRPGLRCDQHSYA